MVVAGQRRLTPLTAATGGGIADGMTMTTPPTSASALALALAPTAAVMMAIARRPFDQEVEDCGAKPCLTMATGGGIAGGMTRTTAPASASAMAMAPTVAATMAIACHPFTQEVEDRGAEPRVMTPSRVSRDDYG